MLYKDHFKRLIVQENQTLENILSITSPHLLDIQEGSATYHGGNQNWFPEKWQQQAGCGPTSCANLMLYLDKTQHGCEPLCPADANQKHIFVELMKEIWQYITPGYMGVNTTKILTAGAEKYAASKGIVVTTAAYDVPPAARNKRNYMHFSRFIANALQQNLPVAFLNLSNGTLDNLDSWHWVTLVALRGDEGLIYDQGNARWINLRQWLASSALGGGLATITQNNLPSSYSRP